MNDKEREQCEEKPLELVKHIAVNDCIRGPHYETPADLYYAQLRAFEEAYDIRINKR